MTMAMTMTMTMEQSFVIMRKLQNDHFTTHATLIKKENEIFLIYKEIQNGTIAKLYMTNGLLIYG
jgi:hypothetical protein